jgi:hypothetical protein
MPSHPARRTRHHMRTRASTRAISMVRHETGTYCVSVYSGQNTLPIFAPVPQVSTLTITRRGLVRVARMNASNSAVEKLCNAYAAYRTLQSPWIALALMGMAVYQLVRGDVFSSALALIERRLEENEVFA